MIETECKLIVAVSKWVQYTIIILYFIFKEVRRNISAMENDERRSTSTNRSIIIGCLMPLINGFVVSNNKVVSKNGVMKAV